MSYILEALKKAQAERQIGSTPTIHAPTLASVPAGQGARSKRAPVIVAMALMATAIAGLAAMLLRQPPATSQHPAAVGSAPAVNQPPAATGSAPIANQLPAIVGTTPTAGQSPSAGTVAAAGQPAAAPAAPPADLAERVAAQASAPMRGAPKSPAVAAAAQPRRPEASAQAAAASAVPAAPSPATPAPAPAPVEEQVQSLRELPEPIQRAIPQITLGGYMYSKNPADRLLLIDKVLRREGEEVAPGLVLEKLQPKQAIFGFRGYRYRVAL